MNKSYKYIVLAILAAGAMSCTKNDIEKDSINDIRFDVKTSVETLTKGQRYNSEAEFAAETFGLYAWNMTQSAAQIYNNESVSKSDDTWKPTTTKQWKSKESYVFEAIYPKPAASLGSVGLTALSINTDPSKLTLSYKVPATTMAAEDKDFMLAYFSGNGGEEKVPLTFTHPLTCVNFKAGTMEGISKINSIILSGVYESGSCTVRTAVYGADSRQCYSYEKDDEAHTSLWTPTGDIKVGATSDVTATEISTTDWPYNFLLIPQDTRSQSVRLVISMTDVDGKVLSIKTDIDTDYWRAGYTNTYIINYSEDKVTLEPIVEPWGHNEQDINPDPLVNEDHNSVTSWDSEDVTDFDID